MKDRWMLVLTAIAASLFAWGFWHYLGANAMDVLSLVLLVIIAVDNVRLRRLLRAARGGR